MISIQELFVINIVFKNLKKYRIQATLGPSFKLLEAIFELFVPLVVADIIDTGISKGDISHVINRIIILIVLGAVGLLFSVTAQYFSAKAAVGCASSIRSTLFDKLQHFSYSQIDKMGTSSMITRMTNDVNQVQTGINLVLRLLLRSPFVVFGAMIMAFTVNARAAIVFAVIIPVLLVVVLTLMLVTIPLYQKVQSKVDGIIGISRENLSGVRVIRAFRREDEETTEFNNRNHALDKFQKSVGIISAIMNPLTFIIINIGIVVLLKDGAVLIDNDRLTSGELVALYNYMSQILVELIKFASLIITVTKSIAGAKRIQSVIDTDDTEQFHNNTDCVNDGRIVFENVSFGYESAGDNSLVNISFTANKGEKIGIIGGTGSGKTTLINLIPAFYLPTGGKITVGGLDISEWDLDDLRQSIGIVPQKAVLFSGTIRDNLRWGNENADDNDLMDAVKLAQAEDIIKSKSNGLNEQVEQGGKNFSGGQRQRLTIARALVRKPAVLILDDSSSALDYATEAALRTAITQLKNTTVFIVSQRASSLLICDKIIVLDDGEQVGYGTHDELIANCDVYSEIYYSQFEKHGEEGTAS